MMIRLLVAETEYDVEDKWVPVSGDEKICLRIVRPANNATDATYPVLVWYHGGGPFLRAIVRFCWTHVRTTFFVGQGGRSAISMPTTTISEQSARIYSS